MATRRERVVLDLVDNFSTPMAKAAAASALLRKNLDELDGTSTDAGNSLDRTGRQSDDMGKALRRQSADIDKFSGRLRLMRDTALILGPALAPLGAGMVPVVGALAAGLGATALAGGTAALALVGLGDAIGALNDYQLEPTAENLQAVRLELEKIGPDGANFVTFLNDAQPALESLQMAARAGLLPGAEDGISALLTDLPQIRDLISQTAEAMGSLTGEAGADLAGPEWQAFWDYLQTDAAPILEQMGHTIGNFANGFANLVVGLAPATRDFTTGLEGLSRRFADWSAGLENNEGFQEFLDYVRQSGPQVVAFVGELASATAAFAQAAAPFGSVVLPVLTKLLGVLADLAQTDVGSMFVAAAAGMAIYNRAAALATTTSAGLTKAMGPWGLALAALAITVTELASADDELVAAQRRAQDALDSGDPSKMKASLEDLNATLDETALKLYPDPSKMNAIPLIGGWDNALEHGKDLLAKFGGATEDTEKDVERLEDAIENGRHGFLGFTGAVDDTAAALEVAKQEAADFTTAIAELDGWLSKRGAIRSYRESIQSLTKGLKDGFNREDRENIDKTAESILRVAEQIKSPALREDFMANARASLEALANKSTPKARAEIQKVIDKLDEFGLTNPTPPKLDVDLTRFFGGIASARSALNNIPDETVNIKLMRKYGGALASGSPSGGGSEVPGTTGQLFGGGDRLGGRIAREASATLLVQQARRQLESEQPMTDPHSGAVVGRAMELAKASGGIVRTWGPCVIPAELRAA